MADINQVISLGIGTPSGILEFLTFGLQIGLVVLIVTPDCRTYKVPSENRTCTLPSENRTYALPSENRTYDVKC